MRRSILTAVFGALLVATPVVASEGKMTSTWGGGELLRVDTEKNVIHVKQGAEELVYELAPDARVKKGRKTVPTGDLTTGVGQRLTIWYATDGTRRVAERITVQEARDGRANAAATGAQGASSSTVEPQ
jgi:hypothetical protein